MQKKGDHFIVYRPFFVDEQMREKLVLVSFEITNKFPNLRRLYSIRLE